MLIVIVVGKISIRIQMKSVFYQKIRPYGYAQAVIKS